jgi:hypothetical protein
MLARVDDAVLHGPMYEHACFAILPGLLSMCMHMQSHFAFRALFR